MLADETHYLQNNFSTLKFCLVLSFANLVLNLNIEVVTFFTEKCKNFSQLFPQLTLKIFVTMTDKRHKMQNCSRLKKQLQYTYIKPQTVDQPIRAVSAYSRKNSHGLKQDYQIWQNTDISRSPQFFLRGMGGCIQATKNRK